MFHLPIVSTSVENKFEVKIVTAGKRSIVIEKIKPNNHPFSLLNHPIKRPKIENKIILYDIIYNIFERLRASSFTVLKHSICTTQYEKYEIKIIIKYRFINSHHIFKDFRL